MNCLVIYDTQYKNTKRVAETIADALPAHIRHVSKVDPSELVGYDLIVVGSPTQGGRPTEAINSFLLSIPENSLEHIPVASFDTRFAPEDHGMALRLLMKAVGFAAPRIANTLIAKGGEQIIEPEGFIVDDSKGPLKTDEIQRAVDWANLIQKKLSISPRFS